MMLWVAAPDATPKNAHAHAVGAPARAVSTVGVHPNDA